MGLTTYFKIYQVYKGTMPRQSRSRSNLSEEEKTKRRREQKKINIRRARAKIDEAALEERRKKDRERYKKKKSKVKSRILRIAHQENKEKLEGYGERRPRKNVGIGNSNNIINNDTISYERWITKTVTIVIKGETKQCKRSVKEKVVTTKKNLLGILHSNLPTYMKHVAYVMHQSNAVQTIKQRLTPEDGLLHIDFSKNYNCKYAKEIQSAHFGGSKIQLSLHTAVYYSTQSEPPNNYTASTFFCTVSENIRHDPVLICVHLHALINRIRQLTPNLKDLHVLSDGPSTQYRNKSMFHLIATYLSKVFSVNSITWHYSERGHGKGAPDGGAYEQTAHLMVSDHRRPWTLATPGVSQMRCRPLRKEYALFLKNTPRDKCDRRCRAKLHPYDLSRTSTPDSIIVSPGTPDAPTVTNSPSLTDRLTPDIITMQQICRPTKRKLRIYSDDTDEDEVTKKPINKFSSDDENIF
ncbi:hypothetical protein evm_011713 [Chilo suppressalis]|nr:hypothetical protein evm_011713 [Chilo suppressalis]